MIHLQAPICSSPEQLLCNEQNLDINKTECLRKIFKNPFIILVWIFQTLLWIGSDKLLQDSTRPNVWNLYDKYNWKLQKI